MPPAGASPRLSLTATSAFNISHSIGECIQTIASFKYHTSSTSRAFIPRQGWHVACCISLFLRFPKHLACLLVSVCFPPYTGDCL
ncbi:hypothetical protein Ancab_013441 [Ancistrocladus abbreviatus]